MSNPTTPFSWQMPTATDLVTDLPADFEVFGQAVATSMADLLGGTTGQVLSKTTNADMDFTWVTTDDTNAIQNSIMDAKGDLIGATAADTPARLAVGANATVLTADSAEATGLKWAVPSYGSLKFVARTSFANVASQTFSSVFSATYTSYLIVIDTLFAATGSDDLLLKFRYGTTNATTGYYGACINAGFSGVTVQNTPSNNASALTIATATGNTGDRGAGYFYISAVGTSDKPVVNGAYFDGNTAFMNTFAGSNGNATQTYTGFVLNAATNITGTVSIYGLATS